MKKRPMIRPASLADWIYPRRCALCDGVLGKKERYVCALCRENLPEPVGQPRCMRCGKPLTGREQEFCYDCGHYEQNFERGQGIFLYQGEIRESMMRFKFRGRKEYGAFFGGMMLLYGQEFLRQVRPQVIVPVPVHWRKLRTRGYNQAQVLAEVISSGLSIPLRTDLVLRKKFTIAQKKLNRKERKKNLEAAFYARPEAGNYERILLVDDIYTTGSTVNAVAAKLKGQGAGQVYVLVACIGGGD